MTTFPLHNFRYAIAKLPVDEGYWFNGNIRFAWIGKLQHPFESTIKVVQDTLITDFDFKISRGDIFERTCIFSIISGFHLSLIQIEKNIKDIRDSINNFSIDIIHSIYSVEYSSKSFRRNYVFVQKLKQIILNSQIRKDYTIDYIPHLEKIVSLLDIATELFKEILDGLHVAAPSELKRVESCSSKLIHNFNQIRNNFDVLILPLPTIYDFP